MKIYEDDLGWRIGKDDGTRVSQVFPTREAAKRYFDNMKIYCFVCQDWIARKELKRWTGDDALHYLCPGCDSDLLPVERLE